MSEDELITLKVEHHFSSAHNLVNYDGKCARVHGHTWNITVYAQGYMQDRDMLIDFTKIKEKINELDHNHLNDILDFNPTAENIAIYFLKEFERLYNSIDFKIQLWESSTCSVTVKSEGFQNY